MWLQLHAQLITFDYITTGKNNGWTLNCDPLESFEWENSTLVQHPSGKHYNIYGRVLGLGKPSWYENALKGIRAVWRLLITWINFDPSMDK